MKATKTKLAATAALALVCTTALAACGTSGGDKPAASASPSAVDSPAASASAAPASVKPKEKLKLVWAIGQVDNTAKFPAGDLDFVKKTIDEKFNVDFQYVLMPNIGTPEYENQINLKLASGEQMDLFTYPGVNSNRLIKDGAAKDLTAFLTPAKVPNYFKWVKESELKVYQVQNVFKRAVFPFPREQLWSYYVRKDWLDKLNLQVPKTYDELVEVMKAFTTKDPDGNGKNDTYGFTTAGNGTAISYEFPVFLKNGLQSQYWVDNGVLRHAKYDPDLSKAIDDLLKLIDLKVIDPDWFLNKPAQVMDKAAQGKVGVFYGWGRDIAFDNNPNSIQKKTKEVSDKNANWVPFNPFGDNTIMGVETNPGNYNPFLVNAKSSDSAVERSMEILNWLTGEEGYLLTHFGKEGVHYKRTGNKIELNKEAYNRDIIQNGNFLAPYLQITPNEPSAIGLELIDPNETDRDRSIVAQIRKYKLAPSIGTALSVKEGLDLPSLSKRGNELINKMLFDDKSSANWPKYRQEEFDKFNLKGIMDFYAEQISAAQGKPVVFK